MQTPSVVLDPPLPPQPATAVKIECPASVVKVATTRAPAPPVVLLELPESGVPPPPPPAPVTVTVNLVAVEGTVNFCWVPQADE